MDFLSPEFPFWLSSWEYSVAVTEQILGCLVLFFLSICSSDELFKLSADCSQNNRLGICKGSGSRKFMHFVCWNAAIFGKVFFRVTSTGAGQLWLGTANGWNLQKRRSWAPVPRVSLHREPHQDPALSLQKRKETPPSKCLFMIVFRLQNSLRTNPTRLLLITGALGQWCLNALQDLDLSYITYSHLPGKTLMLQEVPGSANTSKLCWKIITCIWRFLLALLCLECTFAWFLKGGFWNRKK